MAEGCLSNIVKYALFLTNFLIFLLGVAVLGCGIWVLVDKPSFLDLFEKAESMVPDLDGEFDISLYTSAAYIIIVVAAIVSIIAFFGCFGAVKESKCMLGTYFVLILAMFIVMIVGAVLGYTGSIEETLKDPLKKALAEYKDNPSGNNEQAEQAYKNAWNEVQKELKCCGVDNARDWLAVTFNPETIKVPEGCCAWEKDSTGTWQDISTNATSVDACRTKTLPTSNFNDQYAWEGCFTVIVDTIEENQGIVSGVAIGVVAVMFLNMLFSFAMCTMVN